MNLKQYYEALPSSRSPKTEFVKELAAHCGVSEPQVRNWVKGRNVPSDPKWIEYISERTQIPAEELFKKDCSK